jgi:hypothetical protein
MARGPHLRSASEEYSAESKRAGPPLLFGSSVDHHERGCPIHAFLQGWVPQIFPLGALVEAVAVPRENDGEAVAPIRCSATRPLVECLSGRRLVAAARDPSTRLRMTNQIKGGARVGPTGGSGAGRASRRELEWPCRCRPAAAENNFGRCPGRHTLHPLPGVRSYRRRGAPL